jgi:transposase
VESFTEPMISENPKLIALFVVNRPKALKMVTEEIKNNEGDLRGAADDLGVGKSTIYRWCKEFPQLARAVRDARYKVNEKRKMVKR